MGGAKIWWIIFCFVLVVSFLSWGLLCWSATNEESLQIIRNLEEARAEEKITCEGLCV